MANHAYDRAYYLRNRARYAELWQLRAERSRQIIRIAKDRPCADCGQSYPHYVMEFHHSDRTSKEFTIGARTGCVSDQRLREEIAKCIVLCSNCHQIREHKE
jgi:hypothetical protein